LDKRHFDWSVYVSFGVRVAEKVVDSGSSSFTEIASKFVHIHSDELAGEVCVHVARVRKRMPHSLVAMGQPELDTFADNLEKIVLHCMWDIFAQDIAAKREGQSRGAFPQLTQIDNFFAA